MTLEVHIFNIRKQPRDDDEYYQTFMIETLILKEVQLWSNSNDLEEILQNFKSTDHVKVANISAVSQNPQDRGTMAWRPHFEEQPQERKKPKPSTE